MPNNDILKKYQKRVFKESIIKSILYGLIIGFATLAVVSLIFYIIGTKQVLASIILAVFASVVTSFYVFNTKFKPSINNVAKRIDALGLHERVVTMVDYADSESLVCVKQREDTQEKLAEVKSKDIKFKFSKLSISLVVVLALVATASLFLPNRNSVSAGRNSSSSTSSVSVSTSTSTSSSSSSIPEEDPDEIIQQMLEELRRIINEAEISDGSKQTLHAIVDQLEIDLQSVETLAEKISLIRSTKADIQHKIELMLSVSKCLKENTATAALGDAILKADASNDSEEIASIINEAMDQLIEDYNNSEDKEAFMKELIEGLEFAVSFATEEENTALVAALQNLLDALKGTQTQSASYKKYAPHVVELDEETNAFDEARQEIIDALQPEPPDVPEEDESNDQNQDNNPMEDVQDQMGEVFDEAIDRLEGMDQNESDDTPDPNDGNENGTDDEPNPSDKYIFDQDPLESDTVIDGETPYLDIYDEYYDEIMDYLAGNDVPDELREAIEKYLEMLK